MTTQEQKLDEIEIAPDPIADDQSQQTEFNPPPTEKDAEPEAEKKEPNRVHMSPKDVERLEIAKRFTAKRQDPNDVDYHGDHNDPSQHYGAIGKPAEEAQERAPEPKPEAAQAPEPQPRKIKLKVRGEEIEVPEDEVIADAQKYRAADKYLEDARKIYEDSRRAVSSRRHPDGNQPAPAAEDDPANLDDDQQQHPAADVDPYEELVEKIQYGDKKEAAEALRNTLSKASDQASLEAQWKQRINDDLVRDTETFKSFVARNAEISKDENATTLIKKHFLDGYREDLRKIGVPDDRIPQDEEVLAAHHRVYKLKGQPVRSIEQLLENAKGRFETWRGGAPKPQPNPQPSNGRPAVNVNRTERREAIPHQPSRAAVPQQLQRPQSQPATPADRSSVVQRMRQSRGQI